MRGYFAFALLISAAAIQAVGPPAVINDGHGDYVYVPAGAFQMGDNFGDGESRERPVHTVELDGFYIGKYEVTNAEWKKFRGDPGYDDTKFWPGGRVTPKDQVSYWADAKNHGGGTPNSDNYPLVGVNWDSAVAYCNWLSAKTGKKYHLHRGFWHPPNRKPGLWAPLFRRARILCRHTRDRRGISFTQRW